MLRVAWKSVLGNKLRLALTGVAIVIGVAFVSGTFVLTDSISRAFDGLLTDINEGVDGYVTAAGEFNVSQDGPPGGQALPSFDEDVADVVADVDGVAAVLAGVEGSITIIGSDGEPIGTTGPPKLGFTYTEGDALELRDGRGPTAPGEVVIDVTSAEQGGLEVGDTVTLQGNAGNEDFELVGIVGFGDQDNLLGATIAAFELRESQRLFGYEGRLTQLTFSADGDADPVEVVDAVTEALAGNTAVEVQSADDQLAEQQTEITDGLSFINIGLLAFAGIALFVGAFLIANTFNIIVTQRTREFALLRAVGASGRQVRSMVLGEAFVVGLVASTVGLVGGIAFAQLLQLLFVAIGIDLPDGGLVIQARTVIASYAVGLPITMVFAILPARKASLVAPVEALRGSGDQAPEHIGRGRTLTGSMLAVLGIIALAVGLFSNTDQAAAMVGVGAAALFIGVALLAPYLSSPVAALIGLASSRRGLPGTLARNNAQRNPKRTASTASALMIGVALVTFVSVFASSATASVDQLFADQLQSDLLISNSSFGAVPLDVADQLRELDELTDVASQRGLGPIELEDGEQLSLGGLDLPEILANLNLPVVEGDLAGLGMGEIAVSAERAEATGLALGDTVTFDTPVAQDVTLTVASIYTDEAGFTSGLLVDTDQWQAVQSGADVSIFVRAADGVDVATAKAAVDEVLADYPGLQAQSQGDLQTQVREQVDQLLNVLIGLLFLAVVIALIGIVNTLALSIFERTREIGLLRAVGMTRPQVRTMIRWEAIIVAVFGALLGVALGAFLGWAMVTSIPDLPILEFPAGRMVIYVVFAGLAGIVAAILPARRAANLDVLAAVTAE